MDHAGQLFDALTTNVSLLVLRLLDATDLVRMSEASWSLRRVACDDRVWRPRVAELVGDEDMLKELEGKEGDGAGKEQKGLWEKSGGGYWMCVYGEMCNSNGYIWMPDKKRIANVDMSRFHDNEFKIVVLGDGGSGKSATVIYFIQKVFIEEYDPTIEDSYRKQFHVNGVRVLADILDTAGPEEYSAMRDQYMRTGEGFVVVYSVTRRDSFDALSTYIDQLMRVKDVETPPPMVIVGNKVDRLGDYYDKPEEGKRVKRQVSVAEGRAFAEKHGAPFIESSARLGVNIDEIFYTLVRVLAVRREAVGLCGIPNLTKKKKCVLQ